MARQTRSRSQSSKHHPYVPNHPSDPPPPVPVLASSTSTSNSASTHVTFNAQDPNTPTLATPPRLSSSRTSQPTATPNRLVRPKYHACDAFAHNKTEDEPNASSRFSMNKLRKAIKGLDFNILPFSKWEDGLEGLHAAEENAPGTRVVKRRATSIHHHRPDRTDSAAKQDLSPSGSLKPSRPLAGPVCEFGRHSINSSPTSSLTGVTSQG